MMKWKNNNIQVFCELLKSVLSKMQQGCTKYGWMVILLEVWKKKTFHYLIWFLPFRVDRQLCLVEDLLTSTFQRARVFPSKRKITYYIL